MSYGIIEYNEDGNPRCEICGEYSIRIMQHVRFHHKMTAREYKKAFGFIQKRGICNKESSLKSREKALLYNNIQSEKAIKNRICFDFKIGHPGRSKEMIPEEERLKIIARGKAWGKTAFKKTKKAVAKTLQFSLRVNNEMEGVDRWCKFYYANKYDEDITSEVKVIALEKGKFEDRGFEISSWLIRIAIILYLVKFKHERNHQYVELTEEMDKLSYPDSTMEDETMMKLIENLPQHLKQSLKLRMQGYGVQEISKMEGLELTTIKNKISLARRTLKQQLAMNY